MTDDPGRPSRIRRTVRVAGLVLGPVVCLVVIALLPDAVLEDGVRVSGLAPEARRTAGVASWMAIWWLTEAIHLSATALLPLVLFPLLGVLDADETGATYGNPLIFLFLGGFILGLAMERTGLHRRIALITISIVGTRPRRLVAGFMIATALLSAFVSNTATVIMMTPIAVSLLAVSFPEAPRLARCLLLGIAYGASIGGIATLIGSPPNTVFANFMSSQYGIVIGFVDWMRVGVPVVVVMLPLAWAYLVFLASPPEVVEGGADQIRSQRHALGSPSFDEWAVFIVFTIAACLWLARPTIVRLTGIPLNDASIAIGAGLLLFVIPSATGGGVMQWDSMSRLPWGVLLLFGGGLALARAMHVNGVDVFIGERFEGLGDISSLILLGLVVTMIVFLTELTSNTAVTAALLPVLAQVAGATGRDPVPMLVSATIGASCAFMLPVATPPNAIVYSTGRVRVEDMARAGLALNILAIVIITTFGSWMMARLLPPSIMP
ncbi:MAG: SLC13/DASS family transporter [Phycisphaerales bacterium]|nr:SLC13/DASS family transporter [Phycisphaerales bacterium]